MMWLPLLNILVIYLLRGYPTRVPIQPIRSFILKDLPRHVDSIVLTMIVRVNKDSINI